MKELSDEDDALRGALTVLIAELGHAPSVDALAARAGVRVDDVPEVLQRLADAHSLVLHPGTTRPWVVHPFALAPGSCWVETPRRGYWANCLYCAFGIAAAVESDAVITTRYGGEADTVRYHVTGGQVAASDDCFHLSTPPARWWDNVVFACSTFQPFRNDGEITRWCQAHDLPRGATMTIPQLWGFAHDWYGGYVTQPWRKRSPEHARATFKRHGLTGAFWGVE